MSVFYNLKFNHISTNPFYAVNMLLYVGINTWFFSTVTPFIIITATSAAARDNKNSNIKRIQKNKWNVQHRQPYVTFIYIQPTERCTFFTFLLLEKLANRIIRPTWTKKKELRLSSNKKIDKMKYSSKKSHNIATCFICWRCSIWFICLCKWWKCDVYLAVDENSFWSAFTRWFCALITTTMISLHL